MKYEGDVAVIEELEQLIKKDTWYNEGKDGGKDGSYGMMGGDKQSSTFARKLHVFHFYDLRTFPVEIYHDTPCAGQGRIVVSEADYPRLCHVLSETVDYFNGSYTYEGPVSRVKAFEELLRAKSFYYHDKTADKKNGHKLLKVMHNFRAFDVRLFYDYRNNKGQLIIRDEDTWRLCKVLPVALKLLAKLEPYSEAVKCNA